MIGEYIGGWAGFVESGSNRSSEGGSLSMLVGLLVRSFGRLLVPEEF